MGARLLILKAAVREHLTYDLGPLREPVARGIWAAAKILLRTSSPALQARGFGLLMRLHSGAFSPDVDCRILEEIRRDTVREQQGQATGLWSFYDRAIQAAIEAFYASTNPNPNPRRLIGSRILVVKTARPGERGVIIMDYSFVFPLLAGLFDLPAIADRYTLVLEPSWAGSCTPEILLYSRLPHTVFLETTEPRDRDLLATLETNLTVVPIAANWWVDPRLAPTPRGERDIDVILVAAWADIKRHWRVFRTLSQLRARGHHLKVALVGYQYDRTRADIAALAEHFGIQDQVEMFERISQEEVSQLLVRSKIHVLWSRRECANRAMIEAMLADVPIIAREGLTFGFRYPYINDRTGRFVSEHDLGDAILHMIRTRDQYAPREWILGNMTAEKATAILEQHLQTQAVAAGERWTEGLVVKTSTLDTQRYWNPDDRGRFAADYAFIESTLRPRRRL
jgi:hypothetical protein